LKQQLTQQHRKSWGAERSQGPDQGGTLDEIFYVLSNFKQRGHDIETTVDIGEKLALAL
jgi:hypothetical protein